MAFLRIFVRLLIPVTLSSTPANAYHPAFPLKNPRSAAVAELLQEQRPALVQPTPDLQVAVFEPIKSPYLLETEVALPGIAAPSSADASLIKPSITMEISFDSETSEFLEPTHRPLPKPSVTDVATFDVAAEHFTDVERGLSQSDNSYVKPATSYVLHILAALGATCGYLILVIRQCIALLDNFSPKTPLGEMVPLQTGPRKPRKLAAKLCCPERKPWKSNCADPCCAPRVLEQFKPILFRPSPVPDEAQAPRIAPLPI
eukprot:gnl/TRDRNA2_/TRDRNA2_171992_c0_seq4.p1 gnl/TRDRNA2_/TRDRNA2_171992_c0~~gnl/TRDRNA2_/TRDRNA2_171992_c0_seq4.p1  ORF type:complete len:259 (-),score=35.55 gnl/TRDRNA2_/TRDRNA2_171992_c0_seq4:143-919(-)